MNKIEFAKIIELPENQIVILKNYNDEEDSESPFQMSVQTAFEGMVPKITMGFNTEDKRDEAFTNYNEEKAIKFVDTMKLMLFEENGEE